MGAEDARQRANEGVDPSPQMAHPFYRRRRARQDGPDVPVLTHRAATDDTVGAGAEVGLWLARAAPFAPLAD